jgi:hypothetical protein
MKQGEMDLPFNANSSKAPIFTKPIMKKRLEEWLKWKSTCLASPEFKSSASKQKTRSQTLMFGF